MNLHRNEQVPPTPSKKNYTSQDVTAKKRVKEKRKLPPRSANGHRLFERSQTVVIF